MVVGGGSANSKSGILIDAGSTSWLYTCVFGGNSALTVIHLQYGFPYGTLVLAVLGLPVGGGRESLCMSPMPDLCYAVRLEGKGEIYGWGRSIAASRTVFRIFTNRILKHDNRGGGLGWQFAFLRTGAVRSCWHLEATVFAAWGCAGSVEAWDFAGPSVIYGSVHPLPMYLQCMGIMPISPVHAAYFTLLLVRRTVLFMCRRTIFVSSVISTFLCACSTCYTTEEKTFNHNGASNAYSIHEGIDMLSNPIYDTSASL